MASTPLMMRQNPCQETTFGYLSALESAEHGFFGGYLLISPQGRPLEFHCTSPVRPSRAQQILYGPTLRPYLLGEQIGGTLVAKAELTPKIVLTDQPTALYLRSQLDVPLICLVDANAGVNGSSLDERLGPAGIASIDAADGEVDSPESRDLSALPTDDTFGKRSRRFSFRGHRWELAPGYESDRETAETLLALLAEHVDLPEPFERIHEAIQEAQRIGGRGPDAHGQAA